MIEPPRNVQATAPRRDLAIAGGLVAAALVLYLATASSHLAGGDNAEFVTIFAKGGVAHPSGYPLYCLGLRLFAWMPGGPVLGSSRATAIFGAFAVGALYMGCRAWRASWAAATTAALAYAVSSLAWRMSTEAEVFALHALLASSLLWASGPAFSIAPEWRVVLLAGLAGLALCDHLTVVLLAPVGLYAVVRALVASRSRARAAAEGGAAFLLSLSPYLYCYAVGRFPGDRYVWGEPGTLEGLWRQVTRADYGTLQLAASGASIDVLGQERLFWQQTASHTMFVGLVVGFLGYVVAYARRRGNDPTKRSERHGVIALVATWTLAGPLFAALLSVPSDAAAATLVERFRLLPEVVLALGVAWGLDAWRSLREGRAWACAAVLVPLVGAASLASWPTVRAAHGDALELYTENTLKAAPPNAIILGTGDYRLFSFMYADAVGLRPDVVYVDPHLVPYDWYRARASRKLGAPVPAATRSGTDTLDLLARALALGRPVLVTDLFDAQIVHSFPTFPVGTMIRVLPRGTPQPPPDRVEQENLEAFAQYSRWDPAATDEWAKAVLPTYARPWIALARMFERRGEPDRGNVDRARAETWSR